MGDKRKPWEETWHVVGPGRAESPIEDDWDGYKGERRSTVSPHPTRWGWDTDGGIPGYGIPRRAARLMAASPDLVRALLAVPEWIYWFSEKCAWCREPGPNASGGTHAPDCLRQAALRKAGVIE